MIVVDMEAAVIGAQVSRASIYRWIRLGLVKPVCKHPVAVDLDEIFRVRDEQHARRVAHLARGPVRVRKSN